MRPIPIPDDRVIKTFHKVWVGPPEDDDGQITGVDAIRNSDPDEPPIFAVLMELTPEDIHRISENSGRFWLFQITNSMVPFSFHHTDEFPYNEGSPT